MTAITLFIWFLIGMSAADKAKEYLEKTYPDYEIVKNDAGEWTARKLTSSEVKSTTHYLLIETDFKPKPVDAKTLTDKFGARFAETVLEKRKEEPKATLGLNIHQRYDFEECATLPIDDPSATKGQYEFWCDEKNEVYVRQWSKDGCVGEQQVFRWHEKNEMKVSCGKDKLGQFVELDMPHRVPEGRKFGKKDDVLFWECDCKREKDTFTPTSCKLVRASKKEFELNIEHAIALDGGDCRCARNVEEDKEDIRRLLKSATQGENQKFTNVLKDAFKENLGGEMKDKPDDVKFGRCNAAEMGKKGKNAQEKAKVDAVAIVVKNALEETFCKVMDGYKKTCKFVDDLVCGTITTIACPHTWADWMWWMEWACWPVENTICHPKLREHCETIPNMIMDCSKSPEMKEDELAKEAEALAADKLAPVIDEIQQDCDYEQKGSMQNALKGRRFLKSKGAIRVSSYSLTSTYNSHYPAKNCFDGNMNTMCHGKSSRGDTLTARILRSTVVGRVRIYNRKDCCQDRIKGAEVRVDGKLCGTVQSTGAVIDVICPKGLSGTSVTLKTNQFLNIMQLEIFHNRDLKKYEMKSVGPFGLGNGILPEDSPIGYKDCSADVMSYRGPLGSGGLTICVGAALALRQIQICVGFIFTNDGFFVPHWSYGLTKTPDIIAVRAYLNIYVWASSAAGLMGNTNEIGYTFPVAKYYEVFSIDFGGQITVAVEEGDDFLDAMVSKEQMKESMGAVADWMPNISSVTGISNLGAKSRMIAFNFIVGVSASLTRCDIPFIKNFMEANVYAEWILGCGMTSTADSFWGAELKPQFKPFKSGVKCLSEL